MFSKYVTLLAFAATAIAGAIQPGIYRITNVASHSTARSYNVLSSVFVASTRENPGPFELWDVRDSEDGSYTLRNVGLDTFASGSFGEVVTRPGKGTSYNIESAGNGEFVIKLPYEDAVWSVGLPVIPRGDVQLGPAIGSPTQHWVFSRLNSVQNDYDERLELVHRIGRFLGQF